MCDMLQKWRLAAALARVGAVSVGSGGPARTQTSEFAPRTQRQSGQSHKKLQGKLGEIKY
jgi:hypothetical protein